jgi:indole-3-glycerol phosphate synthase
LRELAAAGYDAFLIGERLMAASDPSAALAEVLKEETPLPANGQV